jgi:hypothetical protein
VLYWEGFCTGADFVQNGGTLLLFGLHADLDELVRTDRSLDFQEHRAGQAFVSDQDYRIEWVRAGFESASFLWA